MSQQSAERVRIICEDDEIFMFKRTSPLRKGISLLRLKNDYVTSTAKTSEHVVID